MKCTDVNGQEGHRAHLQGVELATSLTGLSSKLDLPHATVLLSHMAQLIPSVRNDADSKFGMYTLTMTPCKLSGMGAVSNTGADLVVRLRFLMMRLQPVAPAHHDCG